MRRRRYREIVAAANAVDLTSEDLYMGETIFDLREGEWSAYCARHEIECPEVRDVAESVHCDTQPTTMTPNNHPEEGQP